MNTNFPFYQHHDLHALRFQEEQKQASSLDKINGFLFINDCQLAEQRTKDPIKRWALLFWVASSDKEAILTFEILFGTQVRKQKRTLISQKI